MKITKKQLKRIIKEERLKILQEKKKKGLWDNIRAAQDKPKSQRNHPNSKEYQSAKKAAKKLNNEVDEADNAEFTEKYDDDPALSGDQADLPDALQKGIIDQANESFRRKIRKIVQESNVDGTISDDEDFARDDLMAHVELTINELVGYIKEEAYAIGGPYRGPGIQAEAIRLLADKIHGLRR